MSTRDKKRLPTPEAGNPVPERDRQLVEARRAIYDDQARRGPIRSEAKQYYDRRLFRLFRFNVPEGRKVLELGCGTGDLLAALKPSVGVGVDLSSEMVRLARERHPALSFHEADATAWTSQETFDVVVLSNLVGDLVDVQRVFERLPAVCRPDTRIYVSHYNYLWEPLVKLAELFGLKKQEIEHNWLHLPDLENLLGIAGIRTVKRGRDTLWPVPFPAGAFADLVNDWLGPLPLLDRLCLTEYVVGRPAPRERRDTTVSVIVACKDERGNIEEIFRTVPKMGLGTELIFVDGHSTDGTVEEIERCRAILPELNPHLDRVEVFVQPGKGKGDAVRLGFDKATGEILMILDADITVRSEDLPKFYEALVRGEGEFINGTRLIYPQEKEAMRFLNLLANHFFGRTFSWLLDQRLTDTLCGTKVLYKRDYEKIAANRGFFGEIDPFGDFDLLFGAAKLNLEIREIPIRYRSRDYGEIKIARFRHGLLLFQMAAKAFAKFKAFDLDHG